MNVVYSLFTIQQAFCCLANVDQASNDADEPCHRVDQTG